MVATINPLAHQEEAPRHKRFTRREFDRLLKLGAFEGERYELIDGDLIDKMGQDPPHAYAVTLLLEFLARTFGFRRVRCQLPIEVADADRDHPNSLSRPSLALRLLVFHFVRFSG